MNTKFPIHHSTSRKIILAMLLAAGAATAGAHDAHRHQACSIESGYQLDLHGRAFVFVREGERPSRLSLGGGRLYLDGREATLSPADRERIAAFESELRLLLPEVRKVAIEAVAIAFTALEEVARGLASDPDASIASLRKSHARIRLEMDRRPIVFNDHAVERIVEPLVTEFLPTVIGGAVSMAVRAAFSGEDKAREMERRIRHMESQLEARVEKRAGQLEPQLQNLCERMWRMDALDDALEYRTPDGKPIEFLQVERP